MKLAHKIMFSVLALLIGAAIFGLIRTRQSAGPSPAAAPDQSAQVDQTPLLTAQALASMPTTAAESPLTQQALQLGDEEMDLAFALAVLDATQHPPVLTASAKEIQDRLQKAEDALSKVQARVAQLAAEDEKATGSRKSSLDDQLDLFKARVELRQDEVDDAKQDLIRAGGDRQGRIQQMVQEHEAASKTSDATKINVSTPVEPHGLVQRYQ